MSEDTNRRALDLHDAVRLALRDLDVLAQRVQAAQAKLTSEAEPLETYGAAALIHSYYTHLERLFERIVRDLNSAPLQGPDWHRRLLLGMTLDRPGVRPALFDSALAEDLDELLRFCFAISTSSTWIRWRSEGSWRRSLGCIRRSVQRLMRSAYSCPR